MDGANFWSRFSPFIQHMMQNRSIPNLPNYPTPAVPNIPSMPNVQFGPDHPMNWQPQGNFPQPLGNFHQDLSGTFGASNGNTSIVPPNMQPPIPSYTATQNYGNAQQMLNSNLTTPAGTQNYNNQQQMLGNSGPLTQMQSQPQATGTGVQGLNFVG